LVTSLGLRNTTLANMVRRNGSVISALRSMLFNLIGRHILRLVAPENIGVTVALSSPGNIYNNSIQYLPSHTHTHTHVLLIWSNRINKC
jgi:hypothetical protein